MNAQDGSADGAARDQSRPNGAGAEVRTTTGSSGPSFGYAFAFVFCLGGALVLGGLYWVESPFLQGADIALLIASVAGLSALFARMATFQVAISVTTSPSGVRATWRGPFGGKSSQELAWSDLREVRVLRLGGGCSVSSRVSAIDTIYVTFEQARAILSHPMCPIRPSSAKAARRIGLTSGV